MYKTTKWVNHLPDRIRVEQIAGILSAKGESEAISMHPLGISLTASAYDGVVIVTEVEEPRGQLP